MPGTAKTSATTIEKRIEANGLAYEMTTASQSHVLTQAGAGAVVVAYTDERHDWRVFYGFYSLDEATEVVQRVRRMHGVFKTAIIPQPTTF